MRRKTRTLILIVAFGSTAFASSAALAERIKGKVTYIGTQPQHQEPNQAYYAVFRFRVSESTCGNDTTPKTRWVHVRSGRMDDAFAHNSANFKNAYSTVMTSFLSGTTIEVDGAPNCDAAKIQTVNLWSAGIGLYK